jgi:N-succinyl-L-ornithine transcarbamylase
MNADKAEHVKEAAPVIGGYADILAIRAFPSLTDREADYNEQLITNFNKYAGVPLLSMESATLHPLQSLTDLVTIRELFPQKKKLKVALRWAPHPRKLPQAVANSFAQWINKADDIDLQIVHPKGFELHPDFSGNATISHEPVDGLANADIVYVKNWSAYEPYGHTVNDKAHWLLDNKALQKAPNAKIMHCLPVRRNVVIADEVLDGPKSAVQQQANNRLWSAMAVLHELLREGK